MNHKICIYKETYTTYDVIADSREEAERLVLLGNCEDRIEDVEVKEMEVIPN